MNNTPDDKRPKGNIDGLADTQMARSTGDVFEFTALSNQLLSSANLKHSGPSGGTITDSGQSAKKSAVRGIDEVTRTTRYDVVNEHARGGLGRILEAQDQHLGRTVAIKELLRASTFAESLFVREALITARLQHPGIVPVHEAGRWPSGDPYYVMKLLSGKSLQTWIRETTTFQQRMAFLPNVIVVVETMAYAHSQGVIHRDIKPANIVVGEYGETVVVDWGLARDSNQPVPPITALADATFESGRTAGTDDSAWHVSGNYSVSGKVVGTPAYMSPEQARGEDVDETTDVYALGALLYELLTGQPPYRGTRLQDVLEQVLAGPPRPLDACLLDSGERIKRDLLAIIEKAMAREPGDRYPSAKELAEDLNRFQTGQLVSAHQYTTWTLVRRWLRKHRTEVVVVAAAVVLLAITGIFSVDRVIEERNIATAERAQARAAQRDSESKHRELLYLQAEGAIERDPTATLAWLKKAPLSGMYLSKARELYRDAVSRGVAKHVFASTRFVGDVVYSRDGRQVLVADEAGGVRLINVASGAHRMLTMLDDRASMMRFSPDGQIAAVGARDGDLYIISVGTRGGGKASLLHHIEAHESMINTLAFSTDGRRVLSFSGDKTVNIWDTSSGALERRVEHALALAVPDDFEHLYVSRKGGIVEDLSPTTGAVQARYSLAQSAAKLAVSPDGRYIAAYAKDWSIQLLSIETGAIQALSKGTWDTSFSSHMTFSSKGKWLATRGFGYSIRLWNLETRKQRILLGHQNNIYHLYFSEDESRLISVSDDATARIWDTNSHAVSELRGHTDDVIRGAVAPSGEQIATLSLDGTVRIWDVRANESRRLPTGEQPIRKLWFSDKDTALLVDTNGELKRMQLATGAQETIAKLHVNERYMPVSPDLRFLVMLPTAEGRPMEIKPLKGDKPRSFVMPSTSVVTASWASDGAGFSVLFEDHQVSMWIAGADKLVSHQLDASVCTVALAPGAQTMAAVSSRRVDFLNAADGVRIAHVDIKTDSDLCHKNAKFSPPVYSPDGRWLARLHPVDGIVIVDTNAVSARWFMLGGSSPSRATYSNDSSKLAVHYGDRATYMLHLASGKEQLLGYHKDLVYSLAFSPDDTFLASGSYDQTIRVWNLKANESHVLRGHSAGVFDIVFSSDGNTLGSVSLDMTLRLWRMDDTAGPSAGRLHTLLDEHTTATMDSRHRLSTESLGAGRRLSQEKGIVPRSVR